MQNPDPVPRHPIYLVCRGDYQNARGEIVLILVFVLDDKITSTSTNTNHLQVAYRLVLPEQDSTSNIIVKRESQIKGVIPNSISITPEKRSFLRKLITKHFDLIELDLLCFDLGINREDLPGKTKAIRVAELIDYLERRNRIHELIQMGKVLRPDAPWHYLEV